MHLMFLWKNMLGIIFLILTLKMVRESKYRLAVLFLLLTAVSHRTSAIILALTLVAYTLYHLISKKKWKYLLLILSVLLGTAYQLKNSLLNSWRQWFANGNEFVQNGIFLEAPQYILLSVPLIAFGIGGILIDENRPRNAIITILASISLVWIALGMPFHNRFWPYFDIALILYGGYFLSRFAIPKIISYGLIGLMAAISLYFIFSHSPLITSEEITEIKSLQTGNPETLVIALDAYDAPWLLAYLSEARVAAPGLFENMHTADEWAQFWKGHQQKIFFTRYPQPLVLYIRSQSPASEVLECAPKLSANFLAYQCK
jgi:hypothetical protein